MDAEFATSTLEHLARGSVIAPFVQTITPIRRLNSCEIKVTTLFAFITRDLSNDGKKDIIMQ